MTSLALPLATLSRRRLQLTARTPRELVVPLLTPIMFALVIAPALEQALHAGAAYESFVAIGTIGLLIPLNTMFAGLGAIVDRLDGAQRELLAAPIPRPLLVLGNPQVRAAFLRHHAELLTPEFWQESQRRVADGEMVDFFPYPDDVRFCRRFSEPAPISARRPA